MDTLLAPVIHPLVVQHNALVNARFDLNTIESRLFLALLARCTRNDISFATCRVSVAEIMVASGSNRRYDQVRKMLKDFAGRTLLVEKLDAQGRPKKNPGYVVLPLLAYAEYIDGEGVIEARFNDLLLPYLLELRDNFTKAQLTELLKLKSASSYRIYWLLREYATFGKRTIKLDELKAILGLDEEYDRFDNFKARVLERAKAELAATDLPFTYEAVKTGRIVTDVRFFFQPSGQATVDVPAVELAEWEQVLTAAGIAVASLAVVRARLSTGDYDEGYVHYVLATVKAQVKAGRVKKEAGAIFKALTDGYLLPAYRKTLLKPASAKVKTTPALAAKRKKLLSELDDQRNSMEWAKTAIIYTDETRPAVLARINSLIVNLEQQLTDLGM
jgi:hypothetical protein